MMGKSMKRLYLILAVVCLIAVLAGCNSGSVATATEPPAQAPTDAPYIDTQLDEPEWTLAEGELQLSDSTGVIAENADILYFAIVSNADGSQELRFRLRDEMAAQLKGVEPSGSYFITFNGETVGNAILNDDCTVATVGKDDANGSITDLATKIRGLYE